MRHNIISYKMFQNSRVAGHRPSYYNVQLLEKIISSRLCRHEI